MRTEPFQKWFPVLPPREVHPPNAAFPRRVYAYALCETSPLLALVYLAGALH